jgi:hypothetical protein
MPLLTSRRLLEHVLERADTDGTPVWLETSDPANVGLYEKVRLPHHRTHRWRNLPADLLGDGASGAPADRSPPPRPWVRTRARIEATSWLLQRDLASSSRRLPTPPPQKSGSATQRCAAAPKSRHSAACRVGNSSCEVRGFTDMLDEGSSVEGAFVAADRRLTGWRP